VCDLRLRLLPSPVEAMVLGLLLLVAVGRVLLGAVGFAAHGVTRAERHGQVLHLLWFRVWGLGFKIEGSVQGSRFKVEGFKFGTCGLRFQGWRF